MNELTAWFAEAVRRIASMEFSGFLLRFPSGRPPTEIPREINVRLVDTFLHFVIVRSMSQVVAWRTWGPVHIWWHASSH